MQFHFLMNGWLPWKLLGRIFWRWKVELCKIHQLRNLCLSPVHGLRYVILLDSFLDNLWCSCKVTTCHIILPLLIWHFLCINFFTSINIMNYLRTKRKWKKTFLVELFYLEVYVYLSWFFRSEGKTIKLDHLTVQNSPTICRLILNKPLEHWLKSIFCTNFPDTAGRN